VRRREKERKDKKEKAREGVSGGMKERRESGQMDESWR